MQRIFTPLGKHPVINADLYFETSQDGKYLCCLSERDVFVIRQCLWPFVEWPTRFARPIDRDKYQVSTEAEREQFIEDCYGLDDRIVGGEFMTCLEDGLIEVARAIQAIADRPCCDSSGISGNGGIVATWTDGDGISHPIYGSKPPATNDGVTPPDGFSTYEEYQLNKCQVANMVFDGWLGTMRGLAGLTVFNATALAGLIGFTLAGALPIAPAVIPVMIGALIVLGTFVAMFSDICDTLLENKHDIVCALYRSNTVEDLTAILSDALDVAISALGTSTVIGAALKTVALCIVNSDTLSQLLSGVAGFTYPDADCSDCIGCHTIFYPGASSPRGEMTIITNAGGVFEAEAAPYSDRARFDWAVMLNGTGFAVPCGAMPTVTAWEVTAGSIDGSVDTSPTVKVYDGAGGVIYSDTVTLPDLPIDGYYFEVISGTDVTLRLEYTFND